MIGDFYQICLVKHYRGNGSEIVGFVITNVNGRKLPPNRRLSIKLMISGMQG